MLLSHLGCLIMLKAVYMHIVHMWAGPTMKGWGLDCCAGLFFCFRCSLSKNNLEYTHTLLMAMVKRTHLIGRRMSFIASAFITSKRCAKLVFNMYTRAIITPEKRKKDRSKWNKFSLEASEASLRCKIFTVATLAVVNIFSRKMDSKKRFGTGRATVKNRRGEVKWSVSRELSGMNLKH